VHRHMPHEATCVLAPKLGLHATAHSPPTFPSSKYYTRYDDQSKLRGHSMSLIVANRISNVPRSGPECVTLLRPILMPRTAASMICLNVYHLSAGEYFYTSLKETLDPWLTAVNFMCYCALRDGGSTLTHYGKRQNSTPLTTTSR